MKRFARKVLVAAGKAVGWLAGHVFAAAAAFAAGFSDGKGDAYASWARDIQEENKELQRHIT